MDIVPGLTHQAYAFQQAQAALFFMDQAKTQWLILAAYLHRRRKRSRQRSCWVRPWIARRPFLGEYHTLMGELEREAKGDFKAYLRVDPTLFHELVLRLTPYKELLAIPTGTWPTTSCPTQHNCRDCQASLPGLR